MRTKAREGSYVLLTSRFLLWHTHNISFYSNSFPKFVKQLLPFLPIFYEVIGLFFHSETGNVFLFPILEALSPIRRQAVTRSDNRAYRASQRWPPAACGEKRFRSNATGKPAENIADFPPVHNTKKEEAA